MRKIGSEDGPLNDNSKKLDLSQGKLLDTNFKNPAQRALQELSGDKNIVAFAMVVVKSDGSMSPAMFSVNPAQLALAGAILTATAVQPRAK